MKTANELPQILRRIYIMAFATGLMLIDAPASALNNLGSIPSARTDNTVGVKMITGRSRELILMYRHSRFAIGCAQLLKAGEAGVGTCPNLPGGKSRLYRRQPNPVVGR